MLSQVPQKINSLFVLPAIALSLLPLAGNAVVSPKANNTPVNGEIQVISIPGSQSGAPVLLAQQSRTRRIQFDRGKNSKTIEDAVIRGTQDTYLLNARRGQTMIVKLQSLEDNALFEVVAPPSASGVRRPLRQGAVYWTGVLPTSGDYQVVIGSTRGNATYKLQVTIK